MAAAPNAHARWPAAVATCFALACLLSLGTPAAASAETAQVEVGKVRLATPARGTTPMLLVPVRYPIQLAGRLLELSVSLRPPGRAPLRALTLHERANAGALRLPERRRAFTFVHRVAFSPSVSSLVRGGLGASGPFELVITANGRADIDGDGHPDLGSSDREKQVLPRSTRHRLCSSIPLLRVQPGKRVSIMLPVCRSPVRWRIDQAAEHGSARIRNGRLVYRPAPGFRGTDSIRLTNRAGHSASASAAEPVAAPVQIVVTQGSGLVVRAMGDSVTAGFGYYDDGSLMPFTSLLYCKPGESSYNDACSSNSTNRSNRGTAVNYAPDYGLANNVSWAAQWANAHGVTDYENVAVSGSEPSEWAPGGAFYSTTKRIESEEPDYILMTVGANPLLSDMLFGVDNIGCAIEADILGGFRECIEEAFTSVNLRGNLKNLYRDLVTKTEATIYLMGYPVSVPSSALTYSATQLAMTGKLLNREIASVASEVSGTRLQPILPPHFNVGVDIAPVFPAQYSCSRLGFRVDGQSVQSEPAQDELEIDHPFSFCSGPAEGPPWVISGDTGIHPSAAGYAQMASQVPAPE
ncbi:MAG TPA: SGNH/GDSL hydrolase family protein [Solirubrobacterales bacterium]|nr:SGNH/GDSL hydrolase family protein [Solirubrobacterales bacterium]